MGEPELESSNCLFSRIMARSGENEFTTVVDIESGVIKVTAKLVIKNLVKMMAGIEVAKAIKSDPFKVGETPMTIGVYVNGQDEEERGTIAIFLYNDGDKDKDFVVTAIVEIP